MNAPHVKKTPSPWTLYQGAILYMTWTRPIKLVFFQPVLNAPKERIEGTAQLTLSRENGISLVLRSRVPDPWMHFQAGDAVIPPTDEELVAEAMRTLTAALQERTHWRRPLWDELKHDYRHHGFGGGVFTHVGGGRILYRVACSDQYSLHL